MVSGDSHQTSHAWRHQIQNNFAKKNNSSQEYIPFLRLTYTIVLDYVVPETTRLSEYSYCLLLYFTDVHLVKYASTIVFR